MSILESTRINNEVFKNIQVTSQEIMIIKGLEKFYEDNTNINLLIPIINSESNISIRLIDHFITKYSKNNKINYKIKENDSEKIFNVHTSYKQQLKAFQKKHFDPFSRGDRIPYFMNDSCIITTIGQLNFFKWFFSKNIYDYIKTNQNIIENDMNKKNKIDKTKIKKDVKVNKIIKGSHINQSTNYMTFYKESYKQSNTHSNTLSFANSKASNIMVSFSFK
jgi:hypothetical protein